MPGRVAEEPRRKMRSCRKGSISGGDPQTHGGEGERGHGVPLKRHIDKTIPGDLAEMCKCRGFNSTPAYKIPT